MKKRTEYLIAILIGIFALTLRVHGLSKVPLSPYWEEVAIGYDAYSILKTGKDHHGNLFPVLAFPSFGDFKPSLYFYSVVPNVALFGLNQFAVRLPSALSGFGIAVLLYFIGKELYSNKVGLLAAGIYAVQPWSMHISHVGFETNLATFLITLGVFFALKAKEKRWMLVCSGVIFGLSMYAYHSARIVAPLLGLIIGLYFIATRRTKSDWQVYGVTLLISMVFVLPLLLNIKNPVVSSRAAQTSVFADISVIEESNKLKQEDSNSILSAILHHRYLLFTQKILSQYTDQFSLQFLFLEGDDNLRHQTKEFGLLYHWEVLVILVGLFVVAHKRREYLFPAIWILIAAIPASLTNLSPHTLRFFSASPAFAMLSAFGVAGLLQIPVKKIIKSVGILALTGVAVLEFASYIHYYYAHYPEVSAEYWQYGYKELFQILDTQRLPSEKVYVSREQGRPAMFYAFFHATNPRTLQEKDRDVKKDQQELLQIDDYYFVDGLTSEKGALYATSDGKQPANTKTIAEVKNPLGKVVWRVWRYQE